MTEFMRNESEKEISAASQTQEPRMLADGKLKRYIAHILNSFLFIFVLKLFARCLSLEYIF